MSSQFESHYSIHESRLEHTLAKLRKLSGLAVKLGMEPYTIHVGEPIITKRNNGQVDRYYPLDFKGEQPVIAGWRWLAKIEHTDAGNLISNFSGDMADNEHLATCKPNCQHCNTTRGRRFTFMVEDVALGKRMQVGSTCVDDFIGNHHDPKALLTLLNGLGEISWDGNDPFLDEDDGFGADGSSAPASGLDIEHVLAMACAVIRSDGRYISTSTADFSGLRGAVEISTKDTVSYNLFSGKVRYSDVVTAVDKDEAAKVLEWMKADDAENTSPYRHNLRTHAKLGYVTDTRRHLGIIVSAPASYHKALQAKAEKEAEVSIHLGAVGDKWVNREVIFEGAPCFDNQWGTTYNVLMTDVATGAKLKWATSSPLPMKRGETYSINGTIKGHGEYRDTKQTVLTRVTCPGLALIDSIRNLGYSAETDDKTAKKFQKTVASIGAVDVINHHEITPLMQASVMADDKRLHGPWRTVVQVLLDAGANPLRETQYDREIRTALDIALRYGGGSVDLARLFLDSLKQRGVDLARIDSTLNHQPTSADMAEINGERPLKDVVLLAHEYGLPMHPDYYPAVGLDVPAGLIDDPLEANPQEAPAPAYEAYGNNADDDDVLEVNQITWEAGDDDMDDDDVLETNPQMGLRF